MTRYIQTGIEAPGIIQKIHYISEEDPSRHLPAQS